MRTLLLLIWISCPALVKAQVKYDEGAVYTQGLTFLQSSQDSTHYYYLPQFPRLSVLPDGTFSFLCLKYSSDKVETSGGLLHALVDFALPDSIVKMYETALKTIVPSAKLRGPVPLLETKNESDDNVRPGFEIISGILSNKEGKDAMARSVITSGYAPFTPGSQAAIAALLSPTGTTLIWNSFTGPTSDISIAVNGYYEAVVRAYNAVVTAEMSVIYTHFSTISSVQQGYNKEQIRKITDELIKSGSIKVDVFDRSSGLGIKSGDMEGILSVITNKLTEIMFNSESGWSKESPRVDPNLGFNPKGYQGQKSGINEVIGTIGEVATDIIGALPVIGWFSSSKKKNTNPEYMTDNQFVLKDIKDIRRGKFYLNLSKSTTIKVPFHTAGNLGGLFSKLGEDKRYFRVVNMDDKDYQRRGINFQVDGDFIDAFDDIVNFVTVNFRKKYTGGTSDVTSNLIINGADLKKGINLKEISYPRLGISSSDWLNYEYQLLWSFKGRSKVVRYPTDAVQWIKSSDPAVSLIPPMSKEYIEIDADRQILMRDGIASAEIRFAGMQGGEQRIIRTVIIRPDDKSSTNKVTLYHDTGTPVAYQVTWHSQSAGTAAMDLNLMTSNYVFLSPPPADKFVK